MDREVPRGAGGAAEPRGHRHVAGQLEWQRAAARLAVLGQPHALRRQPWLLLAGRRERI